MMIMTSAPRIIAMAVPATPEFGRNFFPGLMKEPQPMTQPNAMAQTCMGESCRLKLLLPMVSSLKLLECLSAGSDQSSFLLTP